MIVGVACTVVLGILAAWQTRQVAHYKLVARLLGHDYALERAKRKAVAMALGDAECSARRGDSDMLVRALGVARRVATDDTDDTIRTLGFLIPERPR